MVIKVAFSVLGALLISFLILYTINDSYASQFEIQNIQKWEKRFYSQNFDSEQKKVFLIGSSHTTKSDVFYIDKTLKDQGFNYDVYNLSHIGNQPAKRISSIDLIIQTKPDIVLYGLEFLSFWPYPLVSSNPALGTIDEKTEALLPEPKKLISEVIDITDLKQIDFENFKNPKLTTLKIIDVVRGKHTPQYHGGLQPFDPYGIDRTMGLEELQKNVETYPFLHYVDVNSKHIDAMKTMIKKFQENNIPIILFTTPHHELYLETVSDEDKKNYFLIIQSLEKEFEINHYDFHDKYSDLETWANGDHLASGSVGSFVFSDDLIEVIKKEINK